MSDSGELDEQSARLQRDLSEAWEELRKRDRELSELGEQQNATAEVLRVISRTRTEIRDVFDMIAQSAARLCQAEYCFVFRRDGSMLEPVAYHGVSREGIEAVRKVFPAVPDRGSVAGRAALSGAVEQIPDVLQDADYKVLSIAAAVRYRSAVGVPILKDGRPIGSIALTRAEVGNLPDRQIKLLQTFAEQAVIAIENVRLFEEIEARNRTVTEALEQQTATSEVLRTISTSPTDAQPVFEMIAKSAAALCNAHYSFVYRFDGSLLHLMAHHGLTSDAAEVVSRHFPMRPGHQSAGARTVLSGTVEQIPDVRADPDYAHDMADVIGTGSVLAVPILRKGASIGAIAIDRTDVGPFPDRQIGLLQTFADQAVIAIENVRLFEEIEARSRALSESLEQQMATAAILRVISTSPADAQPVFETIVRNAVTLCGSLFANVFRFDGEMLHFVASHNAGPSFAELLRGKYPMRPDWSQVSGRVVLTKAIVCVEDALADPDYDTKFPATLRWRRLLGVPMLRDGEPVGVIVVGWSEAGPVAKAQEEMLQQFADQAVIALHNARLFEEVQDRTRELAKSISELQALGEVTQAVNSTLDLETVLSTIVAQAVQLSSADAGAIYTFSKLRQTFRLRATYGMSSEMIAEIGKRRIGPAETYIGTATQIRHAIQVPDLSTEPASPMRDLLLASGYRGLLVVPLLRADRIVGALVVRRKQPGAFEQTTVDLLQTFAAQSVLAIQNARLFEDVEARTRELARSLGELRAAQDRLVQTEKLASLGQLTAGIAHEIKNPLNFVNNFAVLSMELLGELRDNLTRPDTRNDPGESTSELIELLSGNLEKVVQHGRRADSIVKNMLLHSRSGSGERSPTDINALVEESLNLAYHGARAETPGFNVTLETALDPNAGVVDLLPQEITRVLLNLISNAFYATGKRKLVDDATFAPTVRAATRSLGASVEIIIRDNGTGIPDEVRQRMFDPFFTTKPPGEGTGLGLSLSHDIVVKQHGGSISVDTVPGEFTEFRIILPRPPLRSDR